MGKSDAAAQAPPGPRVFLLGPPRLVLPDGAEHALERKDAALLALLALEGCTPRARLAALLWPNASAQQGRTNLRQRLFRLRRQARQDLVADGGGLRLADTLLLDLTDVQHRQPGDSAAAPAELLGSHDYREWEALDRWVRDARQRWRDTRHEGLVPGAKGGAEALASPWEAFNAARHVAVALARQGRAAEGVDLLERHGNRVEAEGSTRQRFGYWSDLAQVLNLADRRRESVQAWKTAVTLAAALGDRDHVLTVTTHLSDMTGQLGLPDEAHAHAERAFRLRSDEAGGDAVVSGASEMNLARWEAARGVFDSALARFESASLKFSRGDAAMWLLACGHSHATTLLSLGQTARAGQALKELPDQVQGPTRVRRLIVEGRLARASGRSALPHLDHALTLLADHDHGHGYDDDLRLLVELDRSRELDPTEAAQVCRDCHARADALEHFAVGARARCFLVEALLRAGATADAAAEAAHLWPTLALCRPGDLYWPEALWILHAAFAAGGDEAAAERALARAAEWITHQALPHVPEAFADAFLNRNPTNLAVLARARNMRR